MVCADYLASCYRGCQYDVRVPQDGGWLRVEAWIKNFMVPCDLRVNVCVMSDAYSRRTIVPKIWQLQEKD